jgi:hypothetical protein
MRPDTIFALDSYHTVTRGPRRYTDFQTQCAETLGALVVAAATAATNWCLIYCLTFCRPNAIGKFAFWIADRVHQTCTTRTGSRDPLEAL